MDIKPAAIEGMASLRETRRKNISLRYLIDAVTALTAAVTVSPMVAAVDK